MGSILFKAVLDSPHLSLLSPPGLATRYDPHTGTPSVLDLFIGDPRFTTTTFSVGPYMGSDHLPLLASLGNITPQSQSKCLPRWNFQSGNWSGYQDALKQTSPTAPSLPLEEAARSFSEALRKAGTATFPLTTRREPRRPGNPW